MPDAAADASREVLVERWYRLTKGTLPGLALQHGWPIRLDHCFMRVCLDAALGAPWTCVVERPAIRTMSFAQLATAVEVAEGVVAKPDTLGALNERSLAGRRAARRTRGLQGAPPKR